MTHKYPLPKIIGTEATVDRRLGNIQGQSRFNQNTNNDP